MGDVFTARVQRRWVDLDAQGHGNNTLVVDYVQEARLRLLVDGGASRLVDDGRVALTQVEYLRPVPYGGEPLRVDVRAGEIGETRFVLESQVSDADRVVARARTVLDVVDGATSELRHLSRDERACLAACAAGDVPPWRNLPLMAVGEAGLPFDVWPRWSDLDQRGVVSHVRVFDYIQEARVAGMGRLDPAMARMGTTAGGTGTPDATAAPLLWLVARQDVANLAPAVHRPEPYRVRTACARVGTTSITFAAELVDPQAGEAVLARAVTVAVCADASGTPVPVPDSVRAILETPPV